MIEEECIDVDANIEAVATYYYTKYTQWNFLCLNPLGTEVAHNSEIFITLKCI